MANMRSLSIAMAAVAAAQGPICVGNVSVSFDGTSVPMQVAVTGGAPGLSASGNTVTLNYGPRGYIVPSCSGSFEPSMFQGLKLMGKALSYTVDLSSVGCACNAALYLTLMPAYSQSNQPDPTKCDDYYCDANSVCGVYCPEIDIMEANNAALQATPHKCDAPNGNYYPSCDRDGCSANTYKINPNGYGPSSAYIIDTTAPFNVTTQFQDNGSGTLNSVTTILSQGTQNYTLAHTDSTCGSGYLEALSPAVNQGMTVVFSLWGGSASTMSWLDMPPCGANVNCDSQSAQAIFSGIAVTSLP